MGRWFLLLIGIAGSVGGWAFQTQAFEPPTCLEFALFDTDSAVLGEMPRKRMAEAYAKDGYCAQNLRSGKPWEFKSIVISGNADRSETVDLLSLSNLRAQAVRDYLLFLGLPGELMKVVANGDAKPLSKEFGPVISSKPESELNRYVVTRFQ